MSPSLGRNFEAMDPLAHTLFTCDLRLGERAEIGASRRLFSLPSEWSAIEPAAAGDRFLLLRPAGERGPSLTLVDNWRAQPAAAR